MTSRPTPHRGAALVALSALWAGCAPEVVVFAGALSVRQVAWSPMPVEVSPVRAVADAGSEVVVFGDQAAAVFVGGALVHLERSAHRFRGAGVIPAADGAGTWLVGLDDAGRLLRLKGRSSFEAVSDRYGLEGTTVLGAWATGGAVAAFALPGEVAVADGASVVRYATGPLTAVAAGGGRVALAGEGLRELDVATRTAYGFSLPLEGGRAPLVAVTDAGRMFVATPEWLYGEDEGGVLRLRARSIDGAIHGLAASGERVWFADGEELGVVDAEGVRTTRGAHLPRQGALLGSPSGDVWSLASGELHRFAVGGEEAAWRELRRVFVQACGGCHGPQGEAGVDLSTSAAWRARRQAITRRVLEERTMPPPGHPLSEADRASIRRWIEGALEALGAR